MESYPRSMLANMMNMFKFAPSLRREIGSHNRYLSLAGGRSAGRTTPVVEALLFRILEIYQRYLAVVALGRDCHDMLFVPGAGLEREASLDGIVVFAIDRIRLVAAGFFGFRSGRAAIEDLAVLAQSLAIERRNLCRRIG